MPRTTNEGTLPPPPNTHTQRQLHGHELSAVRDKERTLSGSRENKQVSHRESEEQHNSTKNTGVKRERNTWKERTLYKREGNEAQVNENVRGVPKSTALQPA